jgi:hypothetical protein
MKLFSLWAEATVKSSFVLFAAIAVLMTGATEAWAYEQYSINKDSTNCRACHGDFRSSPYNSPSGDSWTDSLHDVHRNTMLSGDCSTCHSSGGRFPVLLDSSSGGDGLAPISCVGCHGRDEDIGNNTDRAAGLRQHHTRAGVTTCTGCHSDAILANYTPVFETVQPNYYATPGNNHPNMPSNPCNPSGGENFAGTSTGLDNDGNGVYDTADTNCLVPVELMIFEIE